MCIVSEGSSAVREELLQEFKVRRAASCIPVRQCRSAAS